MDFCKSFSTFKQACENYPNDNCKGCPNNIFESDTGTQLCELIKNVVENKEVNHVN